MIDKSIKAVGLKKKKSIIIMSDGSLIYTNSVFTKKSSYNIILDQDYKSLPFYQKKENLIKKDKENHYKYFDRFSNFS